METLPRVIERTEELREGDRIGLRTIDGESFTGLAEKTDPYWGVRTPAWPKLYTFPERAAAEGRVTLLERAPEKKDKLDSVCVGQRRRWTKPGLTLGHHPHLEEFVVREKRMNRWNLHPPGKPEEDYNRTQADIVQHSVLVEDAKPEPVKDELKVGQRRRWNESYASRTSRLGREFTIELADSKDVGRHWYTYDSGLRHREKDETILAHSVPLAQATFSRDIPSLNPPGHDFSNPYLRRGKGGSVMCARCGTTNNRDTCKPSLVAVQEILSMRAFAQCQSPATVAASSGPVSKMPALPGNDPGTYQSEWAQRAARSEAQLKAGRKALPWRR